MIIYDNIACRMEGSSGPLESHEPDFLIKTKSTTIRYNIGVMFD
jgi:hypothetical protein